MASKGTKKQELRISFGGSENGKVSVSWLQADSSLMARLVDVVNDCGGAPSFSVTRDGGAWKCYFLHDHIPQDERSQYCRGIDDVDEWLKQLIDFWEGVLDSQKGPQGP